MTGAPPGAAVRIGPPPIEEAPDAGPHHAAGQWPPGDRHRRARYPLLYVLRNDLALNGAKFGCGLGQCGSCTVVVDGQAVYSCLVPLAALEGRQITTLEGLGTIDKPGVLQQAFIDEQSAQCGYCIPGMIMRA